MPRSSPRQATLNDELQQLEADLASLTLRVAQLRAQTTEQAAGRARDIRIGDQVHFQIAGQHAEGVVIALTTHRIRIRQYRTHHIFLRSPNTVVPTNTNHVRPE
jgi:hypothetical protein